MTTPPTNDAPIPNAAPAAAPSAARYAVAVFLSAFLLFQVQPISARFLVPWFGGSSAVWTACLLFFQVALLLGYGYAHLLIRRVGDRTGARIHLALLGVAALVALVLRLTPPDAWRPPTNAAGDPTGRILALLAATVGPPFLALAATGPLLQAWYARDAVRAGRERAYPYRLYALSNLGSMLALVAYPVVVEPTLPLRTQALAWAGGFVVFALVCGSLAAGDLRGVATSTASSADTSPDAAPPSRGRYAYWVALSAIPSVLLLAVTSHVTQNVAAVPFLWVAPLALYLLTFIIVFGPKEWRWSKAFLIVPPLALTAMAYALTPDNDNLPVRALLPIWLGGLFVACLVCHGEMARTRPDPRHLTAFYLTMSAGGALGGLFVALIAPRLFPAHYELPLAVFAAGVVALFALFREKGDPPYRPGFLIAGTLTIWLGCNLYDSASQITKGALRTTRNFYGILQVRQRREEDGSTARTLVNGTILHGAQYVDPPEKRRRPTTYYGPTSGVGRAVTMTRSENPGGQVKIGVIGLGVGTMAAYGIAGDAVTFYEINPAVERLARTDFTYLSDSPAPVEVALGDARLVLERESPRGFDVLAVDAFSSDSIPVHLLTREAFAQYARHLRKGGVLCVHVSNRHLDLRPLVARAARDLGWESTLVVEEADTAQGITETHWVLLSQRRNLADAPALRGAAYPIEPRPGLRPWTDDYVNLWALLRARE